MTTTAGQCTQTRGPEPVSDWRFPTSSSKCIDLIGRFKNFRIPRESRARARILFETFMRLTILFQQMLSTNSRWVFRWSFITNARRKYLDFAIKVGLIKKWQ